jgi:hypothetical protein
MGFDSTYLKVEANGKIKAVRCSYCWRLPGNRNTNWKNY